MDDSSGRNDEIDDKLIQSVMAVIIISPRYHQDHLCKWPHHAVTNHPPHLHEL